MAHHVSIIKRLISLSCAIAFMCFTAWFSHSEISLHNPAVELVANLDDALSTDLQPESGDDVANHFRLKLNSVFCQDSACELVSIPLLSKRYFVAVGRAPPTQFIS